MNKKSRNKHYLVSNFELKNSVKVGSFFIRGDFERSGDSFLVFSGILYPENNYSNREIFLRMLKDDVKTIKALRGYFSGVFFNASKKELSVFNDRLSTRDVFFYRNKQELMVSNSFNEICKNIEISFEDINQQALEEFLIFDYPLFEHTFVNNISFLPLGSIWKISWDGTLKKNRFWHFKFRPSKEFDVNKSVDELDRIYRTSMERVKGMYPKNTIFGLGLSGGLDSRTIAYYSTFAKIKLRPFIFGEPGSDAYMISQRIADKLKLPLRKVGFDKNFIKYAKKHVSYNPMLSAYFSWYYSCHKELPHFNVLLSGFNGGIPLGSLQYEKDGQIRDYNELLKVIFKELDQIKAMDKMSHILKHRRISKIKSSIRHNLLSSKNKEFWQKKVEFNFMNRQIKYIKNNPSFHYYGKYEHTTPFFDYDFVDFGLQIPFSQLCDDHFRFIYFKKKWPFWLRIRNERGTPFYSHKHLKLIFRVIRYLDLKVLRTNLLFKPSHKNVPSWLKNNQYFISASQKIISQTNPYFNRIFKLSSIFELKNRMKTESEYELFFRILTIKLWLDNIYQKKRA